MKITIKTTGLTLTPSIRVYIESKLGALAKFLKKFEMDGDSKMRVEIARTTRHHRHGEVFMAEVNLELPHKMIRVVDRNENVRAAIDAVKNTLRLEIEKHKEKDSLRSRAARRKDSA